MQKRRSSGGEKFPELRSRKMFLCTGRWVKPAVRPLVVPRTRPNPVPVVHSTGERDAVDANVSARPLIMHVYSVFF